VDRKRLTLQEQLATTPGFGACKTCQFVQGGAAALCYACACDRVVPLAAQENRCPTCDHTFLPGQVECGNPPCGWTTNVKSPWGDVRWFDANYAIAIRAGVLSMVIDRYKVHGAVGWATILGRLLVGFIDEEWLRLPDIDLVIASPTYTGPGARHTFDHTGAVVHAAANESAFAVPEFDTATPSAVVKSAETPSMRPMKHPDRKDNARGPLRDAIVVASPDRVANRVVAVYDDVFTDGLTLNEVARHLRLSGASRVVGISLSRQIYSGPRA
jgi:predicted amidophosphoribosyltransferase